MNIQRYPFKKSECVHNIGSKIFAHTGLGTSLPGFLPCFQPVLHLPFGRCVSGAGGLPGMGSALSRAQRTFGKAVPYSSTR
ncbi:MAG TPA: hypothetical protein DEV98_08575 [Clostridiales bacterium]|nr:hypothetical protein [Clostridiales bacterium]